MDKFMYLVCAFGVHFGFMYNECASICELNTSGLKKKNKTRRVCKLMSLKTKPYIFSCLYSTSVLLLNVYVHNIWS